MHKIFNQVSTLMQRRHILDDDAGVAWRTDDEEAMQRVGARPVDVVASKASLRRQVKRGAIIEQAHARIARYGIS